MNTVKEDRRIRRTKKLLTTALAELMCEKNFKDITVKDLTERADLNRGTFYLHYTDTYDLLKKIEDELIKNLEEMIEHYHPTKENTSAYIIIDQVFDYILENIEICRIFFTNSSVSSGFIENLINVITKRGFKIKREFKNLDTSDNISKYQLCFLSYGIIGIFTKWFNENMVVPKENIISIIDSFISSILLAKPIF